jgi:hypothetical protein
MVRELICVPRHLEGDDLPSLERVADHLELHDQAVPLGDLVELVADSSRLVPGPPNGEAGGCLRGSLLLHGQAVLVALEGEADPLGREAVALASRQDEIDAHPTGDLLRRRDVEALAAELADRGSIDRRGVHLQLARVSGCSPSREDEGGRERRSNGP